MENIVHIIEVEEAVPDGKIHLVVRCILFYKEARTKRDIVFVGTGRGTGEPNAYTDGEIFGYCTRSYTKIYHFSQHNHRRGAELDEGRHVEGVTGLALSITDKHTLLISVSGQTGEVRWSTG